jgi:acetoin utilization protein AcuB
MAQRVEEIMTEQVVTVTSDTPLTDAAILLSEKGFNGLPVIDSQGKLIGMFNERNIIADKSYMHLKTALKILSEMRFYKKDSSPIKNELQALVNLKVKDVMNPKPTTIYENESIETAAMLFSDQNNNPLAVTDKTGKLLGIISLSDLTRLYGVVSKRIINEKDVDNKIDDLMDKFSDEFFVVSRIRVSTWFVTSILFALIGFFVAMMLVLRIA